MKLKLAITTLALSILAVAAAPAVKAEPAANKNNKIACYWAKWFLDEREHQREFGHRYHDHDFDIHDSMIDEDSDAVAQPPVQKTVEQYEGSKRIIRVIPEDGVKRVEIFSGSKLNQLDPH